MHACPLVDEAITYSLRQMTPDEQRAYQAHLDACLACRLKLTEISETLDLVALVAPQVPPPPGLKAKVLNRLAGEPAPGRKPRRLMPVWAAAAMVALAVGITALVSVGALNQRLAGWEQAARVERTVAMNGTPAAPTATGKVVVAREGSGVRIALEAQGLPALQPGEAYQLWLIKDGKRRSGGVFVVDATGAGGVAAWLPGQAEFDTLGITREPDALGQQPRGPKVMGSSI
jgi:hypothetical protein